MSNLGYYCLNLNLGIGVYRFRSQDFFILTRYHHTYIKLGIMWLYLFTELKNLKRFLRYDFAKMGRARMFSVIFMEKWTKWANFWPVSRYG